MANEEYLQAFLDESEDNVRRLNDICLRFDVGERDDEDFAAFFRAAHTLKGMSATMGYTDMANLTHRLEDALSHLRTHPAALTSAGVDVLFSCIDALDSMMARVRENGEEGQVDLSHLIDSLEKIASGVSVSNQTVDNTESSASSVSLGELLDGLEPILHHSEQQGVPVGILRVEIDPLSQMKGPRAVLVMRAIEEFAEALKCVPDVESMEAGSYDCVLTFVVALVAGDETDVKKKVENISEVLHVDYHPANLSAGNPIRSSIETEAVATLEPVATNASKPQVVAQSPGQGGNRSNEKMDRTIRVPAEKLDGLMNLLSELVIDRTRLSSIAKDLKTSGLMETIEHMSRISNDLQNSVMSLRLVPVEHLFQRFPRMVRDLAKTLGKSIQLEMNGLETEFDRTIIDEMGEALVHLIRNAADHGLESEADRIESGKSPQGHMCLSAYSAGQDVYIEVSDDGRGIQVEQVLRRAIQNGLVSEHVAKTMRADAVYPLLFHSGFSTAETLSDISGRGVGLDAVKRKVESLGGTIDISSTAGQGTTFRIRLPLTLAIQQALLIDIKGDVYAIPLTSVDEIVKMDESELEVVHGVKCVRHHGSIVPIFDAGQLFYESPTLVNMPLRFVICSEAGRSIAVVVDELIGQEEIVLKSLGAYLADVPWFSGGALLGDGRIALIANIRKWVS